MTALKKYKLEEIANILGGQTFRGKAEANFESEVRLIQIKDITEGYLDNIDNLGYADIEQSNLKVRLHKNNILMPLRGNRQASLLYNIDNQFITTTTNQVAVLTPQIEFVLPAYLLWFLNTQYFKNTLSQLKTGTTISQLSIKKLADITLLLPPKNIQNEIINISNNWKSQKEVLNDLIRNGEELSEGLCFDKIKHAVE